MRTKDPGEVRRDALAAALRKGETGCESCAEGYLELAVANGATEQEILVARRRIITARRLAGAGAAVAGTAAALSQVERVAAYSGLFGTDSNTEPGVAGMPKDFYIGKLGEGPGPNPPPQPVPTYFNLDSARATVSTHVTGYWFMYGPGLRGGATPYNFGYNQGLAAERAWTNNPYCCMRNVFADVEENSPGQYGWGGSQSDNVACVNGFLDGVYLNLAVLCGGTQGRLTPGIYWNPSANGYIFPSSWSPSRNFVLWETGSINGFPSCPGDTNNCAPCNTGCDTLTPVQNNWNAGVYHGHLGGMGIVIWQFWVGQCGCGGDWDYTYQTPSDIFIPIAAR